MSLFRAVLLLLCASLSAAARVSSPLPLSCSQQGLKCTVSTSNCMDEGWLDSYSYTPSGPEELEASWDIRKDEEGHLNSVLVASWKLKDEGSISYINATELHVLVASTNQNLCVRYSFKDKLPMRSPSGEQWSFSAAMVVLDPGQKYLVSVFNIPKPEMGHSHYTVSKDVNVPGCQHSEMKWTQFCIERGSLWQPNISVTADRRRSALAVSFSPDSLCEKYSVLIKCSSDSYLQEIYKTTLATLNVTFSLDKWPRSCCEFEVQVIPFFQQCGQDCARRRTFLNICPAVQTDTPHVPFHVYAFAAFGVMLICAVVAVVMCVICRKPGKNKVAEYSGITVPQQQQPDQNPTVLVIYSQDHCLYRDIVLNLCAFLRAKCGTNVLVDLLDSTSVGMVGRVRWLEWQRQQLKNPSDKILVLCSRGVQAKWRAMCGQGRVTLKEDLLSPTDDMLTPFLNLFLPDMHQAGMLGKYMVAYFDDISSEGDVPSVFDITVKYKLMKHFEELFFRIADIEKYQPGQVNHIEGIGGEEYFNCPSGAALKNAIEVFHAYQLENPDWFERECVSSEEELMTENYLLIDQLRVPPVLECVPLIKDGPPVYVHEAEIAENGKSIHVLIPEVNHEHHLPSVLEVTPVNPERKRQYPSNLGHVLTDHLFPRGPSPESLFIVEADLVTPSTPRQNWLSFAEEPFAQIPTEDGEEESLLPMSQLSTHSGLRCSSLENASYSSPRESPCSNMHSEHFPLSKISHFQPAEMEEDVVLEPNGKGPSSGSDQGYISKVSSQHGSPFIEDPLMALERLQEELFQQNLAYSEIGPECD